MFVVLFIVVQDFPDHERSLAFLEMYLNQFKKLIANDVNDFQMK